MGKKSRLIGGFFVGANDGWFDDGAPGAGAVRCMDCASNRGIEQLLGADQVKARARISLPFVSCLGGLCAAVWVRPHQHRCYVVRPFYVHCQRIPPRIVGWQLPGRS